MSLTLIVGTKIIGLAWGKRSLAVLTLVFRQFVVRLPFTLHQYIIPFQQSVLTMGKRAPSACLALNLLYRKPDYW